MSLQIHARAAAAIAAMALAGDAGALAGQRPALAKTKGVSSSHPPHGSAHLAGAADARNLNDSAPPRRRRGGWVRNWAVIAAAALAGSAGAASEQGPVQVQIKGAAGSYQLYRGGAPYAIKGAGSQNVDDLASLRRHGGNSVRNWAVEDGAILDRAQQLGLTVALCLDLARERHGFDYNDEAAVARQFERMKQQVLAHRNHPALLAWVIGNELNHDYRNPRVYDAVNDLSKMIHALDPNHPTTTTTAGISQELAQVIQQRAPDLDFLSVQVYGGLAGLPDALARIRLDMPLMVTEWGTIGHWEVPATDWGAPIEPNSSEKAQRYQRGYDEALAPLAGRIIGNYAFLWGHKQERTPTWYGLFTADGRRTEAVDVLQRIWTGKWPANRVPQIRSLRLDGKQAADSVRLLPGETYSAAVDAADVEEDALDFEWRLMRESQATEVGGDAEEIPETLNEFIIGPQAEETELRAPSQPGAYRLYIYVGDGQGGVGHANLPFLVAED